MARAPAGWGTAAPLRWRGGLFGKVFGAGEERRKVEEIRWLSATLAMSPTWSGERTQLCLVGQRVWLVSASGWSARLVGWSVPMGPFSGGHSHWANSSAAVAQAPSAHGAGAEDLRLQCQTICRSC